MIFSLDLIMDGNADFSVIAVFHKFLLDDFSSRFIDIRGGQQCRDLSWLVEGSLREPVRLLTANPAIRNAGFGEHLPIPPGEAPFKWFKYLYAFGLTFALAQLSNKISM